MDRLDAVLVFDHALKILPRTDLHLRPHQVLKSLVSELGDAKAGGLVLLRKTFGYRSEDFRYL